MRPSSPGVPSPELHPLAGVAGIVVGTILVVCSLEFVGPFERTGWRLAATLTPFTYISWSLWLIVVGVALLF